MASGTTLDTASRWISFRRDLPRARLRLFCFPFAGGGASAYRLWQSAMPEGVEVCPVQPPGRENRVREAPFRRTEALIDALDEALRPLVDRPFALFGYSMGATLAFEWAHRLRRELGVEPEVLLVAARAAPHLPRLCPLMYELPDDELKARLEELAGTPKEILGNDELMELLLPMVRADFEMHDTYRFSEREPLRCPVVAFGGVADAAVPTSELEAWARVSRGDFELLSLPGDHFGLLQGERLAGEVARRLASRLADSLDPDSRLSR